MYARHLALIALLALLVVPLALVTAGSGDPNFTLGCEGFESGGGQLALDRDNTGDRSEVFVLSAADGVGNLIYEPDFDDFFVGTTIVFEAGVGDSWTRAPRFNPLRLQVISPAGNGLDNQIIAEFVGACASLPTIDGSDGLGIGGGGLGADGFVILPADGDTDEALELNTAPPRPVNPLGLVQTLPGYLVVNTDNLTLRTGDNFRYEQIGVVDGGSELVALGRNPERSWWYVQAGDMRGWVTGEFVVARGNLTDVPVVPVTGEFTKPSLYVGFTGNPVFGLPLPGAPVVCGLEGGLDYAILGRTSSSVWYEIEATCDGVVESAWIPADFGIVRNPANLPILVTYP